MALEDNKISRFNSSGGALEDDDLIYILRDPTGTKEDIKITGAEIKAAIGAKSSYPVGSIYMSLDPTDPATALGYGTWSRIAKGRVLIGLDEGNASYDTPGETGP